MSALEIHRALLEKWRVAMDLVGPGPLDAHFKDAAGAVAGLQVTGRWADLGSGAGFPGVALAVAFPDAEVWLVESRQKRATFLETVVHDAGLRNARVVRARAEDLEGGFDGVIARAFVPEPEYLALGRRLVREGGQVVHLLGDEVGPPAEGWASVVETRYRVGGGHRRRRDYTR